MFQKEHVIYALTGAAVEYGMQGDAHSANVLMEMSVSPALTTYLAHLLDEAMEDELVNDLISERIVEEQRRKKGL